MGLGMVAYGKETKPNRKTLLSESPTVSQGMILTAHNQTQKWGQPAMNREGLHFID